MINYYLSTVIILLLKLQVIVDSQKTLEADKSNLLNLGKVTNCTLNKPVTINVDSKSYCTKLVGYKTYANAISHCKSLNSRLPAPRNIAEWAAFDKSFSSSSWLGVNNPSNYWDWKNIYDNGTVFIKIRKVNFISLLFLMNKVLTSESSR